jgi:hypothetical protein
MPLVLDGDTGIVGVLLTDANGNVTFDTNTLYVDAPNNRVGIGTTVPDGKLTVALENSNTPAFRLSSPTSGTDFAISSYNDANGTYVSMGVNHLFNVSGNDAVMDTNDKSAAIVLDGRNNGRIQFLTNSSGIATPRMTILQDGNVGIGETSPDYRLEVKGTATTNTDIVGFSNSNGTVKHIFGLENVGAGRYSIRDASNNTAVFFSAHDADNSYVNAGSFLVGTTNADVGGSVIGIALKNTGAILASTDGTSLGAQPLYADRRGTNNEGDILMLALGGYYKSSIGVLGTNSGSDNGGITFSTVANNVTKTERFRITSSGYIQANSQSQIRLTLGNVGTPGTNTANWIRGTGNSLGLNAASDNIHFEIGGYEKSKIQSGRISFNASGSVQTNFDSWLTGTNNQFDITIAAQPDYNSGVAYGGLKFLDAGWSSPVGTISMGVNSGDGTEKGYADQMRFTVKKSGGADINANVLALTPSQVNVHSDDGLYIKDGFPYYNALRGTVTTDSNGYAEVGLAGWSWGTFMSYRRNALIMISFINETNRDQHIAFGLASAVYFINIEQHHMQSSSSISATIDLNTNGATGGRKIRIQGARASSTFTYTIKALPTADEHWTWYGI